MARLWLLDFTEEYWVPPQHSNFNDAFADRYICWKTLEHPSIQRFPRAPPCRKAKGVEHMIVDALLEADKAMHFSDKIRDAAQFVTLDDSILKGIENFDLYNPGCVCAVLIGAKCGLPFDTEALRTEQSSGHRHNS